MSEMGDSIIMDFFIHIPAKIGGFIMRPFKKKVTNKELNDAIMAHDIAYHTPIPEPIHAKCEKCGKTDFKDNMVKHEEAKVRKNCSCTQRPIYSMGVGHTTYLYFGCEKECHKCERLHHSVIKKEAYIHTYYKHARCRSRG